uniref:NR LBD domain-containing protein n=1 Tax=Caenorhabditis tropicalis TaxID=1561998 RepID=A0A1I7SXQ8_9PELO
MSDPPTRRLFTHLLNYREENLLAMGIFVIIIGLFLMESARIDAAQHYNDFHLGRHDPARILSMVSGGCQKHEEMCVQNVESVVTFMHNMNILLASHEKDPETELMAMIESLVNDLQHCKDAECVMDFERIHGREFHLALSKVSNIFRETQITERYAEENHLFTFPVPV